MKVFNNNFGLSILEILIAATILSFLTLSVVQITNNSINTKDVVSKEDKYYLQKITAVSRLESDFSQIYTPLFFSGKVEKKKKNDESESIDTYDEQEDDPDIEKISIYKNNANFAFPSKLFLPVPTYKKDEKFSFEFLTFVNKRRHQDVKQSKYTWIRYTLLSAPKSDDEDQGDTVSDVARKSDKEIFNLIRYSQAYNPYTRDKIDWEKIPGYILLQNVTSLEFSFWSEKKEEFVDSLGDIEDGKHLLRAIKVQFSRLGIDGDEEKEEFVFRPIWPFFKEKKEKAKKNDIKKISEDEISEEKEK